MTGYKDPPEEHKFKKGEVTNPGGRPKGAIGGKKILEKFLALQHEDSDLTVYCHEPSSASTTPSQALNSNIT